MTYASKAPEQQKNFLILLGGLVEMYGDKRFDDHFKVDQYQQENGFETEFFEHFTEHDFGTAACLIGHGPIFGIGNGCFSGKYWSDYAQEFFGAREGCQYDWAFLFSTHWTNDIQEAIARLKMYIRGFDPSTEMWDCHYRYAP